MDLTLSSLPRGFSDYTNLHYNLWWSWHPEAEELFSAIDQTLWAIAHHNPVKLLARSQT